jgi:hypothetical protein
VKIPYLLLSAAILSAPVFAKKARTAYLTDKKMENVSVAPGRSVILSFPSRPTKVIVGNQGLFAVEYVENDLAIAALRNPARSNLFVYLEGRRFGFDLRTTAGDGDEILLVRDSEDQKVKVRIKE